MVYVKVQLAIGGFFNLLPQGRIAQPSVSTDDRNNDDDEGYDKEEE